MVEAARPPKDAVSIAASSGLKADGRSVSTSWGPLSVSYLNGERDREDFVSDGIKELALLTAMEQGWAEPSQRRVGRARPLRGL
jgi:hypothetical protein